MRLIEAVIVATLVVSPGFGIGLGLMDWIARDLHNVQPLLIALWAAAAVLPAWPLCVRQCLRPGPFQRRCVRLLPALAVAFLALTVIAGQRGARRASMALERALDDPRPAQARQVTPSGRE